MKSAATHPLLMPSNIHNIMATKASAAATTVPAPAPARKWTPKWLESLALHRPELRAWAMYDWANSAIWTSVIATLFPLYFRHLATGFLSVAATTAAFALATTVGLLAVALAAPVLGWFADAHARRKRMLFAFVIVGATCVVGLFFVHDGNWIPALALFIVIEITLSGSCIFYDSLLPHVAKPGEMDRLSATGYAMGYLGGGLLLAINLLWILRPGWFSLDAETTVPVRLAFVSAALWWVLFSVPLFRTVAEPLAYQSEHSTPAWSASGPVRRIGLAYTELRQYPEGLLMLVAFLLYGDGIGTLIRMATIYGAEAGIADSALIGSFLLVQFLGIPFALLFGKCASITGAKPMILVGLAGYTGIAVFAYFLHTAFHFFILAVGVALVQGGTQALSRSLFASLIPAQRSAQFFAFFAVAERFAGIAGPLVFALVATVTGTTRGAILSVIAFFIVGAIVLAKVDVARGQRAIAQTWEPYHERTQ
jgi:MFS transporter, UMF1 family